MDVLDLAAADRGACLVSHLHAASGIVDLMWSEAVTERSDEVAIALGDASQAIHRALIALSCDEVVVGGPTAFAVEWETDIS